MIEERRLATVEHDDLLAAIGPDLAATFVPVDPARGSWFALWDPQHPGGLLAPIVADLKPVDVELILPAAERGTELVTVTASRLPMPRAIDLLARLPRSAPVHPTIHAWAAVVRAALDLVARGRLLPWVSPEGWDTWRVDPLDHDHLLHVNALAAALPALAHCRPSGPARGRILDPTHVVRSCFDAVGDRMVRSPAAADAANSPIFSHRNPTRVRHLRPWVRDVATLHCASSGLVLQMHPPDRHRPSDDTERWHVVFRLRSQLDPSLIVDSADLWASSSEVIERFGDQVEIDLLAALRRASIVCPVIAPALTHPEPTGIFLDGEQLDGLLDRLDDLASIGVDVRWPSELVSPTIERQLVAGTGAPNGGSVSFTNLNDLLTVDWEFLLDGLRLTTAELQIISEAKRGVVPIRGRWVRLDSAARQRFMAPAPKLSAAQILPALLAGELPSDEGPLGERISIRAEGDLADLFNAVTELDVGRSQAEPAGLVATLRPYQQRGLAWMVDICDLGLGGCLADDMGLGKTIQILALHAHRQGPTLVVCPTSLIANWEREAATFLPDTNVLRYHGPNRSLPPLKPGDLVVTTYGVVRSDAEQLAQRSWDLVVADEAQHAKNPRSRTAKALRLIPSTCRMALTGTPVENRLSELWSIIDWAVPGLFGPFEFFRRTLSTPIERDSCPIATRRLHRLVQPFLLRRKKSDPGIAPELPPKTERNVIVPLTAEQVSLYQATTKETLQDVQDHDGLVRHGLVLKLLTCLKQITNHPAQYLGEAGPLPGRSGKLTALDELVDVALDNDESMLIFSQYVTMGRLLVEHLGTRGVDVEILHGGQPIAARQALVDRFQAGTLPILVLSLKAGGTGLNLTAASHVVHYDRWWNPAVEDQATDRAHRIGQDKSVTVHRLITEGTVEDRVAELLEQKRSLADRVIGTGESWIGSLDDDELARLVMLEVGGQ